MGTELNDKTRAKAIQKEHTRVVKIGLGWNCYLQIDHQSFCIAERTTKKRALYYSEMIGIALDRFLETKKLERYTLIGNKQ